MQEELNVITLSKRWTHHTKSGGYDRLENEVSSIHIKPGNNLYNPFPEKIRKGIWKKIVPSSRNVNGYDFRDFLAELKTFYNAKRVNADVVHSLYGDDQLNMLLKFRHKLNCALVGSYHLPARSEFVQRVAKTGAYKRLNRLDAGIVVSNSMVGEYEKWIGQGKVFFVPHGIDTGIFSPADNDIINQRDHLKVLVVGGHGRDWDVVEKVIQEFRGQKYRIEFHAVVPGKVKERLNHLDNLRLYTGIPEDELINLYRDSGVVLLPVKFATANNSLLEALACGTPVISTNTGGIPDYLDETCGWLMPRDDVKSIVQLLEELLEHPDVIKSKSEAARVKAMKFDWGKIKEQVYRVYKLAYKNWKGKLVNGR